MVVLVAIGHGLFHLEHNVVGAVLAARNVLEREVQSQGVATRRPYEPDVAYGLKDGPGRSDGRSDGVQ
jgi:hypothetical protein